MKTNRDTLLGIVFFAGLGLLLLATAQLKDWTAFQEPSPATVYFPSAGGLRAGDTVTVYGMRAGRVRSVEINPSQDSRDKRILVTLETRKEIPFRPGVPYTIYIEDSSFLGGKIVYVDPEASTGGIPYDPNKPLMGEVFANPLKKLSSLVGDSSGDIRGLLSGLSRIVGKADRGESTIGALFNERGLYDSVEASAESLRKILEGIEAGEGTLGGLVKDGQPFADLKSTLGEVKETAAALNDKKSLLSRLIHEERMGENAASLVEDLRTMAGKARAGEGTLGRLVMSDELHQELKETVREARDLLRQARTGKGIVARIISDQTLGDEFAALIAAAEDIFTTIGKGEGTIGRLVKDDALYGRLELLVRQISGTIEDAREAAPVSTFVNVLGATF